MRLPHIEKTAKYYVQHLHLSLFISIVCINMVVKFSGYQPTQKYILAKLNFTIFLYFQYSETIDIRTSENTFDGNIFEIRKKLSGSVRSSRSQIFHKKTVLNNSLNIQENTCAGISRVLRLRPTPLTLVKNKF